MAGFGPEPIWVQCQDQFGTIYWRNRITFEIRHHNPMLVGQGFSLLPFGVSFGVQLHVPPPDGAHPPLGRPVVGLPVPVGAHLPVAQAIRTDQPFGQGVGVHPNIIQNVIFSPSVGAIAAAWEEHSDKKSKRKYWHNRITHERTWDKPKTEVKEMPPPPPPPTKSPKHEKREQDLWFKVDDGNGGKMWFNEKTGDTQYGVPDCRKKYR